MVQETEPRALHMAGMCSTTELYLWPFFQKSETECQQVPGLQHCWGYGCVYLCVHTHHVTGMNFRGLFVEIGSHFLPH